MKKAMWRITVILALLFAVGCVSYAATYSIENETLIAHTDTGSVVLAENCRIFGMAQEADGTVVAWGVDQKGELVTFHIEGTEIERELQYTSNPNEKIIFNYMINHMGMNAAGACGVLANIYHESGFRTDIMEGGYTWAGGAGYGLCQWTNYPRTSGQGRRTNLVNFCNARGLDYRGIDGQLAYLEYELRNSYSSTLSRLQGVANTADGAYWAGYYWCYYFEVPAGYNTGVSEYRGNFARENFWPEYKALGIDLGADFFARILNTASGMYVVNDHDNVCIRKAGDDTAAWWHFAKNDDGSYSVFSLSGGKYLTVSSGSSDVQANVQVSAKTGSDAQKWIVMGEKNAYQLRAACTSCVLDLAAGNTTEGTNVQMYTANSTDAQSFTIEQHVLGRFADEGEDFYARLYNASYDRYVTNVNTNVASKVKNGADTQLWHFIRLANGAYSIISVSDNRYMDVKNADSENQANIQTVAGNGTDAQAWFIYRIGTLWCFSARCTACVMDIEGGSAADGANIQTYEYNQTDAQKFVLQKIAQPTVTFDAAGGSMTPYSFTRMVGKRYGTLPVPEWENHLFLGWYTQAGERIDEQTVITEENDHTLYAHWEWLSPHISATAKVQADGVYVTTQIQNVSSACTVYVVGYLNGRTAMCLHARYTQDTFSLLLPDRQIDTVKIFLWDGAQMPIAPSESITVALSAEPVI